MGRPIGSALQTLHKVSSKAREQNYFSAGLTHDWVSYYEQRIESDRSCLNEWHTMDSIESRRPPSPDSVRTKPLERTETERVIRCTLKEIMMSVDLDEVTSKYIRGRLEEDLDMDLVEFKPFIDQEMLTILGQMDAATEIFDHVYLGSEWNASNLEELQKNGVLHILNVTREIDNFFPGMFNYLNVRVYDDEKTDLLKHWDNTFKYITRAKKEGSKVLVHCKMGVSRSASVVIAYAMKAFNWDFKKAFEHVKEKRSCIKPNTSFISQLETYQGILDAMKNREKLQRSKSETNLKSPGLVAKAEQLSGPAVESHADLEPTERMLGADWALQTSPSGTDLAKSGGRPKSWSPDDSVCSAIHLGSSPTSVSLERLNLLPEARNHNPNVRMPCRNGQAYSVSQNKVVYLPASYQSSPELDETGIPSVKRRVDELESQSSANRKPPHDRKGLVLDLAPPMLTAVLVKKEIWDPGEGESPTTCTRLPPPTTSPPPSSPDILTECDASGQTNSSKTMSTSVNNKTVVKKEIDPFSTQLDRVFDREERKTSPCVLPPTLPCVTEGGVRECPSRQSSWSSFDSAVVLGYQGEPREAPSRQSSWGSADTRFGTLPSRNSSWGSYDMRPPTKPDDELPWCHGTVKRTKLKLEESTGTVRRACPDTNLSPSPHKTGETTINYKIHGPRPYQSPSAAGFTFPCPEVEKPPFEALNPVLTHYASYPTLHSCREGASLDKIASSQPNMTFGSVSSCAIPNGLDFPSVGMSFTSSLPDSSRPLSVSAPSPSTLSSIGSAETLSHSSTSLPAMASVNPCEIPIPISCKVNDETSSPCIITSTQCASVLNRKKILENLTTNNCSVVDNSLSSESAHVIDNNSLQSSESEAQKSISGLVRNLKKEFEAKSSVVEKVGVGATLENGISENEFKKLEGKGKSLPTSPVSSEPKLAVMSSSPNQTLEDLSVKVLVGKYEVGKTPIESNQQSCNRTRLTSENESVQRRVYTQQKSLPPQRKSSLDIVSLRSSVQPQPVIKHSLLVHNLKNGKSGGGDEFRKPPIPPVVRSMVPSPSVVVASVVAKAASKKQQQGKTHPLARLTIKPRHNNPVYNTM